MNGESICNNCGTRLSEASTTIISCGGNIICSKCKQDCNRHNHNNNNNNVEDKFNTTISNNTTTRTNNNNPTLKSINNNNNVNRNIDCLNINNNKSNNDVFPLTSSTLDSKTTSNTSYHHSNRYNPRYLNYNNSISAAFKAKTPGITTLPVRPSSRSSRRDSEPISNNNNNNPNLTKSTGSGSLIDANTSRVIEAINRAAEEKIREIEDVRLKLIEQIRLDREELLANENQKMFGRNSHHNHSQQQQQSSQENRPPLTINTIPSFVSIYDTVSQVPAEVAPPSVASPIHKTDAAPATTENELVGTIDTSGSVGIRFNPTNERFKVSELGALEYDDAVYRLEARNKLSLLNNDFQYKLIDVSQLIQPVTISKRIELLAPDKVLLIHEKAVGRVN